MLACFKMQLAGSQLRGSCVFPWIWHQTQLIRQLQFCYKEKHHLHLTLILKILKVSHFNTSSAEIAWDFGISSCNEALPSSRSFRCGIFGYEHSWQWASHLLCNCPDLRWDDMHLLESYSRGVHTMKVTNVMTWYITVVTLLTNCSFDSFTHTLIS